MTIVLTRIRAHLEAEHRILEGRPGMRLEENAYRLIYGPGRPDEELDQLHEWDHAKSDPGHEH